MSDKKKQYSLNLKKFNLKSIPDGSICTFIGKRKSGKSFCLRDLIYNKKDYPIGKVISGTEEANPFFEDFWPKTFIEHEFEEDTVKKIIKRQKMLLEKIRNDKIKYQDIDPRMLLVLDDCLYDDNWAKTVPIRNIFMNGRHFKIFFIVTMQYVLGIPPVLRTNIDYTFIFREPSLSNRRRIYENFCGMIPTFPLFCQVLDSLDKYECLVICNDSDKVGLEEQVYWYKAVDNGDFRFGDERIWKIDADTQERNKNEEHKNDGKDISEYRPYKKNSIHLNINKYD